MKKPTNQKNSINMKQRNSTNMKMFGENNIGGGFVVDKDEKKVVDGIDVGRWFSIRECEKIFGDMRSSVWLRRVITKDPTFFQTRKKINFKNKKVWRVLGSDLVVYYNHLLQKEKNRVERIDGGGKYPYIRPSLYVGKKMRSEVEVDEMLKKSEKELILSVLDRYEVKWEMEYEIRKKKKEENQKKSS